MLILADVFEHYREISFTKSKLDPVNFVTSPSLFWNSLLYNEDDLNIEIINNMKIYDFFKKSIRGGLSVVSHRYCKSNHKYLPSSLYNSNKEKNFIIYLDVNNLYGWAMCQYLPYGNFKWERVNNEKKMLNIILNTPNKNKTGYYIECDLSYPIHIHDFFNDYPPAINHMQIDFNTLSSYSQDSYKNSFNNPRSTVNKLVGNLYEKKNIYVIIEI